MVSLSVQHTDPINIEGATCTRLFWAQVVAYLFQCCGHVRSRHAQQQQVRVCDHLQQVRGCTQAGWQLEPLQPSTSCTCNLLTVVSQFPPVRHQPKASPNASTYWS